MAISKSISSIKRFGPRYGRTVKHKFGSLEGVHRRKHKCPYCSKQNVKRIAAGIWQCSKCRAKFASKAYTVAKRKSMKELTSDVAGSEQSAEAAEETSPEETPAEEAGEGSPEEEKEATA